MTTYILVVLPLAMLHLLVLYTFTSFGFSVHTFSQPLDDPTFTFTLDDQDLLTILKGDAHYFEKNVCWSGGVEKNKKNLTHS